MSGCQWASNRVGWSAVDDAGRRWYGGWDEGTLTLFTLLAWSEGWSREDLGHLSLTTDGLVDFDTGT